MKGAKLDPEQLEPGGLHACCQEARRGGASVLLSNRSLPNERAMAALIDVALYWCEE
jgi:hypothetical protein